MTTTLTTPACVVCGQPSHVELTDDELAAYLGRRFVQEAFPNWSADRRELLISGTHPACWTEAFGEED
jgi:hypothetical protein